MATPRSKNIETYIPSPHPSGGTMMVMCYRASYISNRENGQIVKRESPCRLTYGAFSGYSVKTANLNITSTSEFSSASSWQATSSQAYARAYGKFKSLASMPSANVLLNVVEGRKSLEMIAARAFQLRNLASSLRKGRLADAWAYMSANPNQSLRELVNGRRRDSRFVPGKAREASLDEARRWRQLVRDVSSVILEFRYGWSPLMGDIKSACEVLSKPIPNSAIRARVASSGSYKYSSGIRVLTVQTSERVTIKGVIKVTNPNLDLANRLGFLNPALVAWEAVPFSFVVDWFLPVGTFLESFTDFVGIDLIDGSITGQKTYNLLAYPSSDWNGSAFVAGKDIRVFAKTTVRTVTVSLPKPPLTWGRGLSVGRAINAIALLGQMLNPRSANKSRK